MQTFLAIIVLIISLLPINFVAGDVVAKGHHNQHQGQTNSSPKDNDVNDFTEGVQSWDWSKTVLIINHADPFFDDAIRYELKAYEAAFPNMDFNIKNVGTDAGGSCEHQQGAIVFCDAASLSWYGSTVFGGEDHEITWAKINLSHAFENETPYDGPTGTNTLNTVCHELGHAFGLKHIAPKLNDDGTIDESTLDTCMNPYEFGPDIPSSPTTQDIRHIKRLYEEWKQHYK